MASNVARLLLATVLVASPAYAQSPVPGPAGGPPAAKEAGAAGAAVQPPLPRPDTRALDEVIRLDAELERLKKQAEIKEASKRLTGGGSDLPVVIAIMTDASGRVAKIRYATGLVRTVRPGDSFGPHGKVTEIDEYGVRVGKSTYLPMTEPKVQDQPTVVR